MKPRKPFKRKKNKLKNLIFLMFTVLIALATFTVFRIDKKILPAALAASDMQIKTKINVAINDSIEKIIVEKQLSDIDFFNKTTDSDGKILSISVNTVLVNQICNLSAIEISERLTGLEKEKIKLPYGSLLGIGVLANIGPSYTVSLMPMGNALVEYHSKFESTGINQLNFQVWLSVKSTVQVINPLQNSEIVINREIPLVNTVITGEVPSTYFNFDNGAKE